jgi:hypothetical protein
MLEDLYHKVCEAFVAALNADEDEIRSRLERGFGIRVSRVIPETSLEDQFPGLLSD